MLVIINCFYIRFFFNLNVNCMERFYLRLTFGILLIFCSALIVQAQRSNGLTVEGKVSVEEGSVEGAVIQMFQDGRRLDDYGIGSDGRYKVELNYNHKFELVFTRKGNFQQKIVIDANVPQSVLRSDPKFPPFPVDINLFTEIQGIDRTFSENTILKLYYNQQVDNFVSEIYYNDAQIKSLIDQAILQSKMIGKESDYLSKLTRAERAELKKEYDQLLKEAEKEYSNEQFLDALDGYKAANQIFPNEQYPKDRIAEINDLLGLMMVATDMQKALTERFNKLIVNADQLFATQKYFDARNSYNRALSIKPNDAHAKQRVAEIKDILQKQQTEQQYQDLIVRGNNAFNEILYKEALQIFTEASDLRPNETYPKSKIEEINKKLEQLSKNTENQKNYEQAIFQAELNYEKQFYDKALASYENALTFKPGDPKSTAKIQEIKELMNKFANQTLYDKLIKSADKAYNKEQFNEALADYEKALELFPDERHPAERITAIKQKLAAEDNFLAAIQKADQAFEQKEYPQSKSFYNQALEIRANDKHSLDRIKEIDGILASLKVDDNYNNLITLADGSFKQKQYDQAKNTYNEALTMKPREQYPKDKIAEINSILLEMTRNDQKYQQTIARADGLFKKENYEEAKPVYAEAGTLKPEETYPKAMIDKIDSLLREQTQLLAKQQAAEKARLATIQAEKDSLYNAAISKADGLFDSKDYENSRTEYRSALNIKPDETYPQQRIDEITNIINQQELAQKEQAILNKNYDNAISVADKYFGNKNYSQAKSGYQKALEIKSEEIYPKEQIALVDSFISQQQQDEKYREIILAADGYFKTEVYKDAKSEYQKALDVKPDEQYPKNQISKIDDIFRKEQKRALAEQQAATDLEHRRNELAQQNQANEQQEIVNEAGLTSLYNDYITQADTHFDNKQYNVSRGWYYKAWDVKPEETYPPQRIAEINRIVGGMMSSQLDRDYQHFIDLGDSTFRENQLAVARGWYNRALSVKANEIYPKNQLTEIQRLIAERLAGQSGQLFESHVEKANNAFEAQNYTVARFWYKKALELRPNDENVKSKLQEIEKALK